MESCNTESSLDLPLESLSLQSFLQSLHKEQWQEVRLGDITSIIGDGLHGTPNFDVNGECFFINGNNLNDGQIIIKKDTKKVSSIECAKYKKDINEKTILISINGTLGNMALYRGENIMLGKSACYLNFKDNVSRNFMRYVIINNDFQRYLNISATGTTILNVSLKAIRDFTFLLPPLTIQQKIAEILSSFDDKIDLLHRQNKTLESLALTLFRHYFIDNPKRDEWEEKPLSEIAEIQNGYAFKNSDYTERGMETYEVLKMGHIESGGGLRYFPKAHYVKINDKMTKWVLNEDDIVLAMTDMKDSLGILGYPAMVDKSNYYVLNQRVARIYLKSKDDFLHNYFLFLYLSLQENIQKLQSLANGGVQVNLSTEAIKNFTITIPPLEFQSQNNQAFINIIKKYKNNRKQIQNLQAMRDIILKAIFGAK